MINVSLTCRDRGRGVSIITVILRWYGLEKLVWRMSISLKVHDAELIVNGGLLFTYIHYSFKTIQFIRLRDKAAMELVYTGKHWYVSTLLRAEWHCGARPESGFHSCRRGLRSSRSHLPITDCMVRSAIFRVPYTL